MRGLTICSWKGLDLPSLRNRDQCQSFFLHNTDQQEVKDRKDPGTKTDTEFKNMRFSGSFLLSFHLTLIGE